MDFPFKDPVLLEDVATTDDLDLDISEKLIVHNDNVNTFDWVIQSLVEICKHTIEQAEQCAMFIHFKGRYAVKHGTRLRLKPMKDALLDRGISATLEQ